MHKLLSLTFQNCIVMNYYKPYSYLYQIDSDPRKLKPCYVVYVPAGKSLSGPSFSTNGNSTTISYSVVNDANQPRDRQVEYEDEISWDGNLHYITIVIGTGSGNQGGTSQINSDFSDE